MTVVYRAGRQLVKVRFLMVLSLVCAVATLWWGFGLFQTYGSRPADGGELASLSTRIFIGGLVASLGVVFALGMWIYSFVYIASMELDEALGRLRVRTPRFVGSREETFDVAEVFAAGEHAGKSDFVVTPSVNAPWTNISLPGKRLPRILDQQGEFPDPELAQRIFSKVSGDRRQSL